MAEFHVIPAGVARVFLLLCGAALVTALNRPQRGNGERAPAAASSVEIAAAYLDTEETTLDEVTVREEITLPDRFAADEAIAVLPEPRLLAPADAPLPVPATNAVCSLAPADVRIAVEIEPAGEWCAQAAIRSAVKRSLRYPIAARRRGHEGEVTIRLTVSARGELLRAEALPSGADGALTVAALDAAARAAPFWNNRELPDGEIVVAQVPIAFRLVE